MRKILVSCFVLSVCAAAVPSAHAASTVYQGVPPFKATDIPGGVFGGFDVTADGKIVGLVGRDIKLYSAAGVFEQILATVPDYNGASLEYGSFCRLTPDGTDVWVGFTVGGNSDDRIYSVPFAGGSATHEATFTGNYDLEFAQVGGNWKPFVSGTHSTTFGAPNSVWLLDTAADNHVKIADLGGYASGIAFDSAGNLYAIDSGLLKLYRFGSARVQSAATGGPSLVGDNAEFATDMHFAGSDITVDGVDHVFFNSNDPSYSGASIVSMLQPGYAGSYKYDNIAEGIGGYGNWSTQIAFGGGTGDVLLVGGGIYVADFWSSGGVTLLAVPEPATVALLSSGLFTLGALMRRRMS
ncbi:MAG TPA: PEP-CTERM sorting domain-containing protein [Planctomycetota bacterium]|nr:PEP-CTERM sorting domain-containing protein [Planctomycetota bacterium]